MKINRVKENTRILNFVAGALILLLASLGPTAAYQPAVGGAGDSPAPLGDPPGGMRAIWWSPDAPFVSRTIEIASGESPDATGGSPVLPTTNTFTAAQEPSSAEVLTDLLDTFRSAQVSNPKATEVRHPASAGGVREDGLFAHPVAPRQPARVDYALELPPLKPGDLILLAFDIALSDGIQPGPGVDGVRFIVEVDRQPVFSEATQETRWQSHAVDLTPFAGRRVALALVTDAIASSSYDWSTWGNPRVLLLRHAATPRSVAGKTLSPITAGVLALRGPVPEPLTIRLKPVNGGNPIEWSVPAHRASGPAVPWAARDFLFAGANVSGIELEWEPKGVMASTNILLAAYQPNLELTQFGPTRALVTVGDSVPLRVQVRNVGRGKLAAASASARLRSAERPISTPIPALGPGESWQGHWDWKAPAKAGSQTLYVELVAPGPVAERSTGFVVVARPNDLRVIQNDQLKIEFARQPSGYAHAIIHARQGQGWAPVAVWRPLLQVVSQTPGGEATWEITPRSAPAWRGPGLNVRNSVQFTDKRRDSDGVEWEVRLGVKLESNAPVARLRYEWTAAQNRDVHSLLGPNLYVGDGTTGESKTWGLFPGLEYLFGAERSSNERDFAPTLADRRTPHPNKITAPVMAVTIGPDNQAPPESPERFFCPDSLKDLPLPAAANLKSPISDLKSTVTVALLWNPLQRWDGEHVFPSARFASPNFDEGMANHRLGLFLPSAPAFVAENATRARPPYALAAGKTLTLEATLVVAPGPATVALRHWLNEAGGLPQPNPWPRTFQQELDVCRAGLLKTVWDDTNQGWRHCIEWKSGPAPGLAALLWLDAHLAERPEARQQSQARVDLAATNMLRDGGPGLLTSQAACHIMQWEFPFLYGRLAEALPAVDRQVSGLIRSQRADGGWAFHPGNEQQKDLGQAGDSVLGLCASHAAGILRYARITGDRAALVAGEKALRFMEQFRVPRGAQTWECPMYEPDILAAAYAVRACHDAWRVTGNPRWLHDAVYWAETGVPFIYLWTLPDKPMMLGATIPVFGSTFYTHTWLAVPVQWCGLVYAYHVFHLAEELARTPLPPTESPLPLALQFTPADWRRLVELITVSGLYQQYADGPRIGTYPDSISNFERRNPAFLNPEDVMVNVLALQGHDPDVKTARVRMAQGIVAISSGATPGRPRATTGGVTFDLAWFPGATSHTLITGLNPREVRVNGQPLAKAASLSGQVTGWGWEEKTGRTFLTVPHKDRAATVEILTD